MTTAQPAPLLLSTAFGLLMAAAAAVHANPFGLIAAGLAALAVLVGIQFHTAATVSVLLAVAALVLSAPAPLFAALCGLSAAAYLVVRHAAARPGVVTTTWPTVLGIVGFTFAGAVVTALPLQLPWLPVLAPPAIVAIFALVTWPFLHDRHTDTTESS